MDEVKKYLKEKYKKPGMFFWGWFIDWISRCRDCFVWKNFKRSFAIVGTVPRAYYTKKLIMQLLLGSQRR